MLYSPRERKGNTTSRIYLLSPKLRVLSILLVAVVRTANAARRAFSYNGDAWYIWSSRRTIFLNMPAFLPPLKRHAQRRCTNDLSNFRLVHMENEMMKLLVFSCRSSKEVPTRTQSTSYLVYNKLITILCIYYRRVETSYILSPRFCMQLFFCTATITINRCVFRNHLGSKVMVSDLFFAAICCPPRLIK